MKRPPDITFCENCSSLGWSLVNHWAQNYKEDATVAQGEVWDSMCPSLLSSSIRDVPLCLGHKLCPKAAPYIRRCPKGERLKWEENHLLACKHNLIHGTMTDNKCGATCSHFYRCFMSIITRRSSTQAWGAVMVYGNHHSA